MLTSPLRADRRPLPTRRRPFSPTLATLAICAAVMLTSVGSARAQTKLLRYAHIFAPSHSIQAGADRIATAAAEGSGGEITLRVLPSGQVGNERQIFEGVQLGTLDMAYVTANIVQAQDEAAGAFSLPYLFKGLEEAFAAEDGPAGQRISARILKTTGVRVLGYNATGFRSLVVRPKSVNSLADFKGLKVRVPESPLMVSLFRNLGANPTPIPWGELYTALQTGVIDAAESPPSALDSIKIFEVAKNLTLTNHVYTNGFIMINDKAWQGLSPKSQSALAKAVLAGQGAQREVLLAEQGKIIAQLKQRGVNVIEIDTAPLRAAVAPMYAEFTKKVGDQTLLDALAKSK